MKRESTRKSSWIWSDEIDQIASIQRHERPPVVRGDTQDGLSGRSKLGADDRAYQSGALPIRSVERPPCGQSRSSAVSQKDAFERLRVLNVLHLIHEVFVGVQSSSFSVVHYLVNRPGIQRVDGAVDSHTG